MLILSMVGMSQFAFATATPTTKIQNIYVYSDYIVMKIADTLNNVDNCTKSTASSYLFLATNTEGGKKMYSAALTAYVSGKKILAGYSGCEQWGSTTIPKAYGISLQ